MISLFFDFSWFLSIVWFVFITKMYVYYMNSRLISACAAVFVHAIEEHVLQAQHNGCQDRKNCIYWHLTWQHLIWPQFTDDLLKLPRHMYHFHARLTSAWRWGEVECTSEKSPVWSGHKDVLHLIKSNSCQEKRDRNSSCECRVQAPPLCYRC